MITAAELAPVTIAAVDPAGPSVTAGAAEAIATPASEGGWSFVARPRRSSFTKWSGVLGYTLDVQVLFDGFPDTSVEATVETLRRIYRTPVGPRGEPAVCTVKGPTIPLSWLQWVIQNIVAGDEIRREDGQLVRAFRTVTFMQYLGSDLALTPGQAAAARAGAGGVSGGTYTVKPGDTLGGIAVQLYGDFNRWHDIANLNGIRDPTALQIGQVLKLP